MAEKKRVFVAFAIEDERQRDLLKGQSLHPKSTFEYVDLSVKEAYETGWKEKVRTRIKGCHGVIALVSKNSSGSEGQKWEIACSQEEKKPILGIRAYADDKSTIAGITVKDWTKDNLSNFIDSL
ncbi:TIR domain-containing protein [Asaia siamensis]|uniref:Thoeris protein ThsB TIR-like domain-containing protein n=1 Tax=Asaia siamensis TaxID=110479 RepID=A0ABQ1LY40_9PROT|nr:TIR domain-containing protein [Asaia siamensis]GBR02541.1 hypothetical protein AA0323_0006 [Asaia siamensis NRIC 0323]GGC31552.1 hypothetical protein GCM10007207_16360 [Asaia siamensis]